MPNSMLNVKNICLSFGKKDILKDINFDALKGEIICLLGPSGCGKTSMLRLIAGLDTPESGSITIGEEIVSTNNKITSPHSRGVGFLFQDFALFPHLTVEENIRFGLYRLKRKDADLRVRELLSQIQMKKHAKKYPHMLSGGEQQRVALARARAPWPSLLLLDEPFSGLDTGLRKKIREETLEILKNRNDTAIMVTHDPEEAMAMADRIVLMQDGHIIQIGTPKDIYHRPKTKFAAQFFGDVNQLNGKIEKGRVKTELGYIADLNILNGSEVEVLIRPEEVKIVEAKNPRFCFYVCNVRDTGSSCIVKLASEDSEQPHTHILASYRGPKNLQKGALVGVEIAKEKVFIVCKENTSIIYQKAK